MFQPDGMTTLSAYRDLLTDVYLRWLPVANLTQSHFVEDVLGFRLPSRATGIIGFGVGSGEDNENPGLLILAKEETTETKDIYWRIKKADIPVSLRTGVFFVAAAGTKRPAKGGHSIGCGTTGGETGTMGCVVKDRSRGSLFAHMQSRDRSNQ